MAGKVCFVVTGFGEKTDFQTGRKLNMDKTYEHLIKPVFDELNIKCIRAKDIRHSGVIDVPMYEYILNADIVVADISTLNPNAIYELGVRHALRPFSTIVIAEDKITFPFDLSHVAVTKYEHLGVDIGASEVARFRKEFKALVEEVLANQSDDSPVFRNLNGLQSSLTKQQVIQLTKIADNSEAASKLLEEAEKLKGEKKFDEALAKLEEAEKLMPNVTAIIQRKALITYKKHNPPKVSDLVKAEKILEKLNPELTNDIETLGLLGAINKRLYEVTNELEYVSGAIGYYERGFLIGKDYYNGINLAFLYLVSASLGETNENKIADIVNARRVREKVNNICIRLYNQANFKNLSDKVWILLTLAEIASIDSSQAEADKYVQEAKDNGATAFDLDSYQAQQDKIKVLLGKLKK